MIRVVTYNVLSPADVNINKIVCDPKHVTYEFRLAVILKLLSKLMNSGCIICLQEVTDRFYDDLKLLPEYSIIRADGESTNYCAILYPNMYKLLSRKSVRVGEEIFKDRLEEVDLTLPHVKKARNHKKHLLIATFANEVGTFRVATYHAPVPAISFKVSVLHVSYVMKTLWGESDEPVILAGDFNFGRTARAKKVILNYNMNHVSDGVRQTTYVVTKQGVFKSALDHIFCSNEFKTVRVTTGNSTNPLPNEDEGSDHVHILAVLELTK